MMGNAWRDQAKELLREGYGVEDISVRLSVDVNDVRQFVDALRASGRLREVVKGRKKG